MDKLKTCDKLIWHLMEGLLLCCNLNISYLVIELDAKAIVEVLGNSSYVNNVISPMLDDCRLLVSRFQQIRIKHCFREVNRCADSLARMSFTQDADFSSFVSPHRMCSEPFVLFYWFSHACLLSFSLSLLLSPHSPLFLQFLSPMIWSPAPLPFSLLTEIKSLNPNGFLIHVATEPKPFSSHRLSKISYQFLYSYLSLTKVTELKASIFSWLFLCFGFVGLVGGGGCLLGCGFYRLWVARFQGMCGRDGGGGGLWELVVLLVVWLWLMVVVDYSCGWWW